MSAAASRLTADERREEIVAAASIEFADAGYAGTSTDAIARRSGVSQPYLFQLFGTKKELFIAAVRDCFLRTERTFEQSGKPLRDAGLPPAKILEEMGHAYVRLLLADRGILRLQLQAYAACGDPEIQTVVRDNYGVLWRTVADLSGADPDEVRKWFANGMLINVIASLSNTSSMEDFFVALMGGDFTRC
jgi:AcrR family transcriptional regulator